MGEQQRSTSSGRRGCAPVDECVGGAAQGILPCHRLRHPLRLLRQPQHCRVCHLFQRPYAIRYAICPTPYAPPSEASLHKSATPTTRASCRARRLLLARSFLRMCRRLLMQDVRAYMCIGRFNWYTLRPHRDGSLTRAERCAQTCRRTTCIWA